MGESVKVFLNNQLQTALAAAMGDLNYLNGVTDLSFPTLNTHDEITVEYKKPVPREGEAWLNKCGEAVYVIEDRGVSSTIERLYLVESMKTGEQAVVDEHTLVRQISEMEAIAQAAS